MASCRRRCPLLLFGSQSGNAADVADKVWRSALLCGAACLRDVRVRSMDSYVEEVGTNVPPFPEAEWAVVFICSTTGQGDPPDNMMRFWKKVMRRSVPGDACQRLKVAVFGMGDSSYPKYNFVAKKLFRRLAQLGAEVLLPLGLADDQHPLGVDGALTSWLASLLAALVAAAGEDSEVRLDSWSGDGVPCKFHVRQLLSEAEMERGLTGREEKEEEEEEEKEKEVYPSNAFLARVVSNQRVTSDDHFQDTRHVVFAKPPGFPAHSPGQVLMVQPSNCAEDVATFLGLVGPPAGARLSVTSAHPTCHPVSLSLGAPRTLAWFARHYFDLNMVPRKSFFELLAAFSADPDERERLQELSDAANIDDLFAYCFRPRRTCLEVLQDFPRTSRALSVGQLFEVLPGIRARAFSLASSARAEPDALHLLVAVVDFKSSVLRRRRRGLCSSFLATGVRSGDRVPVWMAEMPGLRFPDDLRRPLVMVGPGTGVAPFRSVLQERRSAEDGGTRSRDVLFFGCRSRDKDFYFCDEWRRMEEEGHLKLVTAFSRDQVNTSGGRLYVQDRLREEGSLIWRLLSEEQAYFFVAGNARQMPDAVREAVIAAASQHGGLSAPDAEAFVTSLERSGRYQAETWS